MAVYIFGASCSGKSTLSKALEKDLGSAWVRIDRDDLIEKAGCKESEANTALEKKVQSVKNRVIIDAQIPWREKQEGELYFLVAPPLEVLLKRDQLRSINLQRPEKRAYYARNYVIKTHETLAAMKKASFDHCFDSSQVSVEEEVAKIKTFLRTQPCSMQKR